MALLLRTFACNYLLEFLNWQPCCLHHSTLTLRLGCLWFPLWIGLNTPNSSAWKRLLAMWILLVMRHTKTRQKMSVDRKVQNSEVVQIPILWGRALEVGRYISQVAGCRLQVAGWNLIITGKPLALKIVDNLYTRQGFLHKVVHLFHIVKTRCY